MLWMKERDNRFWNILKFPSLLKLRQNILSKKHRFDDEMNYIILKGHF